jgi:hypothetical protein
MVALQLNWGSAAELRICQYAVLSIIILLLMTLNCMLPDTGPVPLQRPCSHAAHGHGLVW